MTKDILSTLTAIDIERESLKTRATEIEQEQRIARRQASERALRYDVQKAELRAAYAADCAAAAKASIERCNEARRIQQRLSELRPLRVAANIQNNQQRSEICELAAGLLGDIGPVLAQSEEGRLLLSLLEERRAIRAQRASAPASQPHEISA